MRRRSLWFLGMGVFAACVLLIAARTRLAEFFGAPIAATAFAIDPEPAGYTPGTPATVAVDSCQQDSCTPTIPAADAWIDHGFILAAGAAGEWDHILWGAFGLGVIRKDGRFHLYYQGSKYYDEQYETVGFRSIGVATSEDGVQFTKYSDNPVLTWLPNNWLEEGAVSSGVSVLPNGQIAMFYGANTRLDEWQVNADGRLALSDDGLAFRDAGMALNHRSRTIWGSGDELFPIIGFSHANQWYVYYLPNGTAQARKLGVAWGSDPSPLSARVTDPAGASISAWGPGSFAPLGGGEYALFLNNGGILSVWRMNVSAPDRLTGPIATYSFPNMSAGTVLLDGDTFHLFYINDSYDAYGVRTAPAF